MARRVEYSYKKYPLQIHLYIVSCLPVLIFDFQNLSDGKYSSLAFLFLRFSASSEPAEPAGFYGKFWSVAWGGRGVI